MNAPQIVAQLVGCRNYRGAYERLEKMSAGEGVVISRNPGNVVDFNAVQVHDPEGLMLGHLDAGSAACIAPFMDAGIVYIATIKDPIRVIQRQGKTFYGVGSCFIRCTPLPPLKGKRKVETEQPHDNEHMWGIG